jgi:hypothetical protein
MPAARLDAIQAETDVSDDGFGRLSSKSCAGAVAVFCGTIAPTNNSNNTGCASQTPASTDNIADEEEDSDDKKQFKVNEAEETERKKRKTRRHSLRRREHKRKRNSMER